MLTKIRIPEIVLGALLTVAVLSIGFVIGSLQQPPTQQQSHQINQTVHKEPAKTAAEERIADYTWWLAWLTGILAASTVGLWVVTYFTLRHSRETAQRELRAYLVVGGEDLRWPEGSTPIGQTIAAILEVKNTGQTPAHEVRNITRTNIVPVPLSEDFDFSIPPSDDHSVGLIGPGEKTGIEALTDPITGDDWIVIRNDPTRRLCTYGTITYRDVFGDPHYTNFCIVYAVQIDEMPDGRTRIRTAAQTARYHNDAS